MRLSEFFKPKAEETPEKLLNELPKGRKLSGKRTGQQLLFGVFAVSVFPKSGNTDIFFGGYRLWMQF